ncbi:unnamed protein product, partial [Candidula unifasciata]
FNWFNSRCRYRCHCSYGACSTNGECYWYSYCEKGWFGPSCQYGRNVALGQDTTQSSTKDSQDSTHAVDGDTNPDIIITAAYQRNNRVAFMYTASTYTNRDIYIIESTAPQIPVSSVTIFGRYESDPYLTLCEVEMFGDCDPTFWGDKCAKSCSVDCKDQLCNAINGTCFSSCNTTYYGENCTLSCSDNCADQLCNATSGNCLKCVTGKYGLFCDGRFVVVHCSGQLCDAVTGKCASCVQGLDGDYCNRTCPSTKFGENCTETCSTNCSNQLCDAVTGKCTSCVQGMDGDYCNQTCNTTWYGENCSLPCSQNCSDQLCNAFNGRCLTCVFGRSGEFCHEDFSHVWRSSGCDALVN